MVSGALVARVADIIESRTGWTVENVGLPWARVQREVAEGRIDAMVTYASTERLEYARASNEAVYWLETKAFVRAGSVAEKALRADPSIEIHRRFAHCRILGDDFANRFLRENEIPFEAGQDSEACMRQVAAGRQDVFLHIELSGRAAIEGIGATGDLVALPKVYASVPLHFLLSKRSPAPVSFLVDFDEAVRGQPQGRVVVATLDWPPYTGAELPDGGAVSEAVRQAFDLAGFDTEVMFVPWKRAIAYAKTGQQDVVAYFPGYHCRHDSGFIASEPIGHGPLGFAERADKDIAWRSLDDIADLRIGTVVGYANTDAFDARVADGRLDTVSALDDTQNLMKLAAGKIDIAVVDHYVFRHLVTTRDELIAVGDGIRLDQRTLEDKNLYLCVRDGASGRELLKRFNAAMRHVDPKAIWDQALETN